MPPIGLGVYRTGPGEPTYSAVLSALRIGYRHIDTAQFYENEADVGRWGCQRRVPARASAAVPSPGQAWLAAAESGAAPG